MNKTILLTLLVSLLFFAVASAQSDSIEAESSFFGGTAFYKNGEYITPLDVLDILESNPDAYKEFRGAKTNRDFGNLLGTIGGGLVGFPIGTAIGGGDPNWVIAGIGAGLIVVSIPFYSLYSKRAVNAVRMYNEGIKDESANNVSFHFGCTETGVGLRVSF